jgi:hypothetical protein
MKTNVFIWLILSILICSCSGGKKANQNDLDEINLYGDVKSVKEFAYEAIDKFGEISNGKRISDPYLSKLFGLVVSTNKSEMAEIKQPAWLTLANNSVRFYNDKGNMTEMIYYNIDGNISTRSIYKYNTKGNNIETNRYESNGNLYEKIIYIYDDKCNNIEEVRYNPDGSIEFKFLFSYDNDGNKTGVNEICKSSYDDSYFEIKCSVDYKFDNQGNVIEKIEYSSDGSLDNKCSYIYDDNDNMIQKIRQSSNETDHDKYKFSYDEKGNIVEESKYDKLGQLQYCYKYKYEFDDKMNWIRRIDYENEIPCYVIERQIEYY